MLLERREQKKGTHTRFKVLDDSDWISGIEWKQWLVGMHVVTYQLEISVIPNLIHKQKKYM